MSNHDKVYENVIEVLTNNELFRRTLWRIKTVEIIDKIYVCKSFELMEPILFESGIKNVTFGENVKLFNQ
jgi:hypothetical protein